MLKDVESEPTDMVGSEQGEPESLVIMSRLLAVGGGLVPDF